MTARLIMDMMKRLNRFNKIVELRSKGHTLREIGEELGISTERVRQILLAGQPTSRPKKEGKAAVDRYLRKIAREKKIESEINEIRKHLEAYPLATLAELSRATKITMGTMRNRLKRGGISIVGERAAHRASSYRSIKAERELIDFEAVRRAVDESPNASATLVSWKTGLSVGRVRKALIRLGIDID
jgi:hypothetical protein